jgi:hypothetical protein
MKTPKTTVTALRAIGVEFAKRTLRPLVIGALAIAVILIALGGWLASTNAWWWLLEVPILIASLVLVTLIVLARGAIKLADPVQTPAQKAAVKDYADKLQRVSENLKTPQYVIVYRVVRDTVRPPKNGQISFIENVSRDSKTLAPDFAVLLRRFDD